MRRCLRRALLQPSLVFGRSGQPVSMLFPTCSQVYLGCRDGVPMIPGGSSSSGREPMLVGQPMLQRSAVLGGFGGRSRGVL